MGKTYWSTSIAGLRFCDTPSGLGKCKYYEKGSFTVTGLAEDIGGDPAYAITTGTGENGYVPWTYAHEFVTEDPAKTKVKAAAECKRRGEPRIGMTAAQAIATCWGKPERVNRTQTGARTSDQYVYPGGRYLYFQNGVLTSMQVSGTLAR